MSELTKEKIYKKELEKVGGEGNNNLERIRSLGGGSAFEDIVDKNGNPRFVEGNGTPETITGVTSLYCKWSLSGTHLMLVYALTLDSDTGLSARTDICSFELPQWILDKIYPASNGLVNVINALYVPEGGTPTTKEEWLYKTATGLKITNKPAVQATTTCYLRIQFDLLIDSE